MMLVEHDLHALVLGDAPFVEKAVIERGAFGGIVITIGQRDPDRTRTRSPAEGRGKRSR